MSTLILEHIPVAELPAAWRAKLQASSDSHVTVRIEQEKPDEETPADQLALTNNPLFGMWRDHPDVQEVENRMKQLRQPRFSHDGSRNES